MGYWVNTTYVNHGHAGDVSDALVAVCRAEGMELVPTPPQRTRQAVEPMQYEPALRNDLWGAAIFPGAAAWTIIQTAPLELLAERAPGSMHMRLADLCRLLSVSAFQFNVYDSTGMVLAEVSPLGEVLVSGFTAQGNENDLFDWHGETLKEELFEARFQLHPFQSLIADALLGDDKAEAISRQFGAHNSKFCDNSASVDTLICHKPFTAPGGAALYFKWPGATRQRYASCASWDEYRSAVGKP